MPYISTLTDSDIQFGKAVAERLHGKGFDVKGVFWLYDQTSDDWQLIVATPTIEKLGSRGTYLQIFKQIADLTPSEFQKMRLVIVSPEVPLLRALRSVFGSAGSVEGARLQNTTVNGIMVPNAYLYEVRN